MRISATGIKVLKAFMYRTGSSLHGYELMQEAEVASGTLYPLLMRFEESGLLTSKWEQPEPDASGRPRRRLYQLTALGQRTAQELMHNFSTAQGVA